MQKILSLIRSHLFIFRFHYSVRGGSKRILLWFMSKSVCLCFPISFIVSSLTFRSLIHFEFVYIVRKCSNFVLLHVAVPLYSYILTVKNQKEKLRK